MGKKRRKATAAGPGQSRQPVQKHKLKRGGGEAAATKPKRRGGREATVTPEGRQRPDGGDTGTARKSAKGGGKGKGSRRGGRKGAGKGSGKSAEKGAPTEGSERKAGSKRLWGQKKPQAGKQGKAMADDGSSNLNDANGAREKKRKLLSPKATKRKEVTSLYSELLNPDSRKSRKSDKVVNEILQLLDKRPSPLSEYCSTEVGSRVLQACLKWGSMEQRCKVLTTLKKDIAKLAVDRYGHVVVLKLLTYVSRTSKQRKPSDAERKAQAQNLRTFLEEFQGKSLRVAFYHRYGCRVINGMYFSSVVSSKEKRRLLHDVAVPQSVTLLKPELLGKNLPLRQLLHDQSLTQEQRATMTAHLKEAVEKAIDKELLRFDIAHILFQAFCEDASEEELKELAEKCMAGAPYMLSSKPGAEAVLRLLGVATAKQRKALCRDLKGKFTALATNSVDYVVMIRLATTVDDTVLLVKTMLTEWIADMGAICFDKYGHRVLAWLLQPDDRHLFSPYERSSLALPAPSSMKAPETRRQELVRALRPPLRSVLLQRPLEAAADMQAKNLLIAYLASAWDAEVVEALVDAGVQQAQEDQLGLLGSGTTTTTLLTLFALETSQPQARAEGALAEPLWRRCFAPRLTAAATSRCAFLLLGLLKNGGGSLKEAVLGALRKHQKEIQAATQAAEAAGAVVTGARKLLATATGEGAA